MSKNGNQLNEEVLAELIREADDQIFRSPRKVNYQEHLTHTAHHIAVSYHRRQQSFLRRAVKPHQTRQNEQQRALKLPISTKPSKKGKK